MKASELVAYLQALIVEHGDMEAVVEVADDTGGRGQEPCIAPQVLPYDPYKWVHGCPTPGEPVITLRDY